MLEKTYDGIIIGAGHHGLILTYVTLRYEFGQAHRDGSALVLGRDLKDSVANIARFSKKMSPPAKALTTMVG